jgi:REP element-mobilizing transposase RayT
MARPLRIEYPGAFYHVTARGNEQKDIFKSQKDREKFLSCLEAATKRFAVVIHAYCLMGNHYHLLLETPQGNLSQIMKHINSSYTTYFNVKRKRAGHLLQGRYKAILIDADEYALELSRYIHLNPVRVGIADIPENYTWMSYRCYTGHTVTPDWLRTNFILGFFGRKESAARKKYQAFVNDLIGREYSSPLKKTVASTILGSVEFVAEIQEQQLSGKKKDRELPTLRKLAAKPSLYRIVEAVRTAFPEDRRLATKAGIYLCHHFSGVKLREIGELFQLSESGITQASRRFGKDVVKDKKLREKLKQIAEDQGLSNV